MRRCAIWCARAARAAAVKDRTRKRQEIRSFLLRHGKVFPGQKTWGTKYFNWLHGLSFGWPGQTVVLPEMIVAETQCRERVVRLERAIDDALFDGPLAPVVSRLQALRGVGLIATVTFMVEVGVVRRFEILAGSWPISAWCPMSVRRATMFGYETRSYRESRDLFALGRSAVFPAGNWEFAGFRAQAGFELGAFRPPVREAGGAREMLRRTLNDAGSERRRELYDRPRLPIILPKALVGGWR